MKDKKIRQILLGTEFEEENTKGATFITSSIPPVNPLTEESRKYKWDTRNGLITAMFHEIWKLEDRIKELESKKTICQKTK